MLRAATLGAAIALAAASTASGQGYRTAPEQVAQTAQQAGAATWGAPPDGEDTAFVTFGLGAFDINDNESAAEFRVAWRGRRIAWLMKPLAGVMGTSDGAVFAYGGVLFDIYLGRNVVLTPSFAPGLYGHGGGKDLGSVLEFRSAVELAWRFHDHSRLGLMFYHMSNASIGDRNPGTEVLSLSYSLPLK